MSKISALRAENASVKLRLDALQADLAAGGGVVFRRHTFTYLDLARMRQHIEKGRSGTIPNSIHKNTVLTEEMCMDLPHVTICLLGKFKGETGVDHHLITVANETIMGLDPRWRSEKLLEVCKKEGR